MLAPKPSDGTRSRKLKVKIFARDVIATVNPVVIHRKLHKRFSKPKALRGEIKAPPTVLNDVKLSDREILAINLSVARGELYVINKRICELHESWKKLEAKHYVSYPSSLPHPFSHPPSR
jgi:YbbR domain-containing protein